LSLHAIPFELAELERVVVGIEVDCAEVIEDFELFLMAGFVVQGRFRNRIVGLGFVGILERCGQLRSSGGAPGALLLDVIGRQRFVIFFPGFLLH